MRSQRESRDKDLCREGVLITPFKGEGITARVCELPPLQLAWAWAGEAGGRVKEMAVRD